MLILTGWLTAIPDHDVSLANTMTTNIVQFDQSSSPFDSIKKIDGDGTEFWSAREFSEILGYPRWADAKDMIDRAKHSCQNSGNSTREHFSGSTLKTTGRPKEDWNLSRYGAYLVAMNGDPRKPEVAAAQSYFAVKTREAETVIPAMSEELRKLELQNKNMELQLKVYEAQQKTLSAAGLKALSAPALVEAIMLPGVTVIEKVEHIDRTVIIDRGGSVVSQLDGIGITSLQKQFGFKTTKAAWTWLESIGFGKESGHWQDEMTAHTTAKLDRSALTVLKQKFSQHFGDRQKLLGE